MSYMSDSKEWKFLIEINQNAAMYLRKTMPRVHIHKTMQKKSSRGKYFVEETAEVKKTLLEFDNCNNVVLYSSS